MLPKYDMHKFTRSAVTLYSVVQQRLNPRLGVSDYFEPGHGNMHGRSHKVGSEKQGCDWREKCESQELPMP